MRKRCSESWWSLSSTGPSSNLPIYLVRKRLDPNFCYLWGRQSSQPPRTRRQFLDLALPIESSFGEIFSCFLPKCLRIWYLDNYRGPLPQRIRALLLSEAFHSGLSVRLDDFDSLSLHWRSCPCRFLHHHLKMLVISHHFQVNKKKLSWLRVRLSISSDIVTCN